MPRFEKTIFGLKGIENAVAIAIEIVEVSPQLGEPTLERVVPAAFKCNRMRTTRVSVKKIMSCTSGISRSISESRNAGLTRLMSVAGAAALGAFHPHRLAARPGETRPVPLDARSRGRDGYSAIGMRGRDKLSASRSRENKNQGAENDVWTHGITR